MHNLQRIGLLGITVLLLLGFWGGLWYQGQRKGEAMIITASESRPVGEAASEGQREDTPEPAPLPEGGGPYAEEGIYAPQYGQEEECAVHVVGRVASPGLYYLPRGSRIYDAVMEAEPEEDADLGKINMAMPIEDGMQIRVPIIGKPSPWDGDGYVVKASDKQEYVEGGAGGSAGGSSASGGKVDINKATAKELEALPGIGPSYSQRIVEYREKNGGFKSIEDLQKVKGIGPAKMSELRDKVCV